MKKDLLILTYEEIQNFYVWKYWKQGEEVAVQSPGDLCLPWNDKGVVFFMLNFLAIAGGKANIFKVYLCVSVFIMLLFNMQLGPHEVIHKYLCKHKLKNYIFPFALYFVDFV